MREATSAKRLAKDARKMRVFGRVRKVLKQIKDEIRIRVAATDTVAVERSMEMSELIWEVLRTMIDDGGLLRFALSCRNKLLALWGKKKGLNEVTWFFEKLLSGRWRYFSFALFSVRYNRSWKGEGRDQGRKKRGNAGLAYHLTWAC
jgi:hypothetical protein